MSKEEADTYKNLGNKLFSEGKYQESIENFNKAIEIYPNDPVYYSNRSGAFASLKNYDQALQDSQKCIDLKPEWGKGYQRKGLALFYLEKYEDAKLTYEKGIEVEPENKFLKEGLDRVNEKLSQPEDNQFFNQMFTKLMMNPKTREYLKDPSFMQKLQLIQSNPAAATGFLQDPKIQEAFQVMFSDMGGQNFDFQNQSEQKQEQQQHQHTSNCNHSHSEDQEPKFEHGKQQQQQKQNKDQAEQLKDQGNEFYKKKDFQKALEFYEQAISLKPIEPLYYNNKAACYIEMDNMEKAIQVCDEALKTMNDNCITDFVKKAKILARKGSALFKCTKYQEAIESYEASLLEDNNSKVRDELKKVQRRKKEIEDLQYQNPELAEQHNNNAKEFFQSGKFPEALKEYQEAIKRNPTDPKYYTNLATCYIKLMEFPSALTQVEKALKIDSNFTRAWAKKGQIHLGLKETHKAIDSFEKGLKVDSENQECKQGLQKAKASLMSYESQENQEERARHAMADPEIQAILKNPIVMNVLRNAQENPNPQELMKAMSDKDIGPQLQKLIQAGILRMGQSNQIRIYQ